MSMDKPTEYQELTELLSAVADELATDAQLQRLDEILAADPVARRYYRRFIHMQVELTVRSMGPAAEAVGGATGDAVVEEQHAAAPANEAPAYSLRRTVLRYALAASLVLALGLTVAALLTESSRQQEARRGDGVTLATLIETQDAVFDASDVPTEVGSQLPGGFIRLRGGMATIRFRCGATVTLEGPAEFGLNSDMRGFLRKGKLLANVPPQAHGFTIGAKGVSVIDMGTEFGMVVGDSGSQVHVLKGRVNVMTDGDARQLQVGNACEVSSAGAIEEIRVEPRLFARQARPVDEDGSLVFHAVARQSSSYGNNTYVAQQAIDGDPHTFSHTALDDMHPWFQLDLESQSVIKTVVLHNRVEGYAGRLRDITVEVLDREGKIVYTSPLLNPKNVLGGGAGNYDPKSVMPAGLEVHPGVLGVAIRVSRTPDSHASGDDRNVLTISEIEAVGHVVAPPDSDETK